MLDTSGVDLDLADPVDAMNSGKPNKKLRLANMKVTLFEYEQMPLSRRRSLSHTPICQRFAA